MNANPDGVVWNRMDQDTEQRRVESAARCLLRALRCSPPPHHHITSLAAPLNLLAGPQAVELGRTANKGKIV